MHQRFLSQWLNPMIELTESEDVAELDRFCDANDYYSSRD
jgi:glycine cleavage system protein P-like pyridoxal-binding family